VSGQPRRGAVARLAGRVACHRPAKPRFCTPQRSPKNFPNKALQPKDENIGGNMKKLCLIVPCMIVFGIFAMQVSAHKGVDHEKLVEAMSESAAVLEDVNDAVKAEEYFTTAERLMGLAKIFKSLESIIPEKGTKEEWDTIHGNLIKAAFKAIGACADEDGNTVRGFIKEIKGIMKKGHGVFR
jgi:hypothetical protein